MNKRFIAYLKKIENEKLYYFMLANANPQPVLIIKSPSDNKEQKQFLGYEWSNAKGNEGISYNGGDTVHDIITPMFDPTNPENETKINYYIQQNFQGHPLSIPDNLKPFLSITPLEDLLDFSRKDFNKAVSLSVKRETTIKVESKWEVVKLSTVIDIIGGGTPDTKKTEYWNGDIPWLSVADFNNDERYVSTAEKKITELGLKNSSTKYLEVGEFIISARGTVGALAQLAVPMTFNQSCYGLRAKENKISKGYLYYILKKEINQLKDNATGVTFGAITTRTFESIKIPLPPLSIQAEIVAKCEAIDAAVVAAKEIIKNTTNLIVNEVAAVFTHGYDTKKLETLCHIKRGKRLPKGLTFAQEKTEFPYIRVADFGNKTISLKNLEYITKDVFEQIKNYTISAEDVYISIAGTIGLCGSVPNELNNKSLTENAAKLVIREFVKFNLPTIPKGLNVNNRR